MRRAVWSDRIPEISFFVLVSALATSAPAAAATIAVDGVVCTLSQAIEAANSNSPVGGCIAGNDHHGGGDIISLTGDVTLTSVDNRDANQCPNGLPAVTSKIRINGHHHTIARAPDAAGTPLFRVLDAIAGELTISKATISNGFLESFPERCQGAGINGNVILIDSVVSGNRVFGGDGVGINGTAVLKNSSVLNNSVAFGNGGGINGTATLVDSTVSGNRVGTSVPLAMARRGMAPALATIVLDVNGGGGIAGAMKLVNSTVSNNTAGDAGIATGGGLLINGTATIINSTISGNLVASGQSIGGGITVFSGSAAIANSTISGNRAFGDTVGSALGCSGVGIFSSTAAGFPGGTVTLTHTTVADNVGTNCPVFGPWQGGTGAGVFGDSVTLVNSIIANNPGANPVSGNCYATNVLYLGRNLIEDASCNAAASGQLTGDPMLGPLGDYGGRTAVQPPLAGSPAIDQISIASGAGCGGTSIVEDQRGVSRPRGTRCDIGSVEFRRRAMP